MNRLPALLAILLLSAAPPAFAVDYFGSMAFCPKTGAVSWARNYTSQSEAEEAAVDECIKQGGKSCRALVWFKNACGSIAIGERRGAGSGWGSTKDRAELEAMKSCSGVTKKCKIKYTKCTEGYDDL